MSGEKWRIAHYRGQGAARANLLLESQANPEELIIKFLPLSWERGKRIAWKRFAKELAGPQGTERALNLCDFNFAARLAAGEITQNAYPAELNAAPRELWLGLLDPRAKDPSLSALREQAWSGASEGMEAQWAQACQRLPRAPWLQWACPAPNARALLRALALNGHTQGPLNWVGIASFPALSGLSALPANEWLGATLGLLSPLASIETHFAPPQDGRARASTELTFCKALLGVDGLGSEQFRRYCLPLMQSPLALLWHLGVEERLGASPGASLSSLAQALERAPARWLLGPEHAGARLDVAGPWVSCAILSSLTPHDPRARLCFSLGAEPNAMDENGFRAWQAACMPYYEMGMSSPCCMMTPQAWELWARAGADFSLPVITEAGGNKKSRGIREVFQGSLQDPDRLREACEGLDRAEAIQLSRALGQELPQGTAPSPRAAL